MSPDDPEKIRRIREEAIDWVLLLDGNEPSSAKLKQLEGWLAQDQMHVRAFEQARQLYGEAGAALTIDPDRTKRRVRTKRTNAVVLGSILVAFLIAAPFLPDAYVRFRADMVSATNETQDHLLSDGSRLHMNAETAIVENYRDAEREIILLQGEAFFDVGKDPSRAFVVLAAGGRIEALGTRFNVNRIGERTEVTVTESAVRVKTPAGEVTVSAGMRVTYDADGHLGDVQSLPEGMETPWRSGRLVFEDRPLGSVIEEIDRHIEGNLIVVTSQTAEKRVSGSFDLSDPAQALQQFADVFGLQMYSLGPVATVIR